jgi:hypothetical protein
VTYWSIKSGEEIKSLQFTTNHYSFRFAKKNTLLVTCGAEEIDVWNLEGDRATLSTATRTGTMVEFDVAPSGDVIAVAYRHNSGIRLSDASTGSLLAVYRGHNRHARSVRFSPQGDRLVSTSRDWTTRVWNTTKEALSANSPSITQDRWFKRVQFSPDGEYIVAIARDDPRIFVCDGKTGIYLSTLTGHTNNVKALAFSPDVSTLASVSPAGSIRLWDMRADATHPTMMSQRAIIESLAPEDMAFNSTGTLLALVSIVDESFVVSIYDITSHGGPKVGEQIFQSKPNNGVLPHLIRFSPNEPLVRVRYVRTNEIARVWDYENDLVEEFDKDAHLTYVLPFGFEKEDRGRLQWIVSTSTKGRLLYVPRGRRTGECMDVHGDRLAIGSNYGILTLLDMSRLRNSRQ